MHFLMGLNDSFSAIRGQILSTGLIPPITKVFFFIIQEEKQRLVAATPITPVDPLNVFVVKNSFAHKSMGGKNDRPLCAHCGLLSHS